MGMKLKTFGTATPAPSLRKAAGSPVIATASRGPGRWEMTILNFQPVTLNDLLKLQHMKRHTRKQHDYAVIMAEALIQGVPEATCKRRVSLRLILGKGQRGADPDAYWKCLFDALVACRLLIDDSGPWVEQGTVEFDRGSRKATVILLEDLL